MPPSPEKEKPTTTARLYSPALLTAVEALLPPKPPGLRASLVHALYGHYAGATIRTALRQLEASGRAIASEGVHAGQPCRLYARRGYDYQPGLDAVAGEGEV